MLSLLLVSLLAAAAACGGGVERSEREPPAEPPAAGTSAAAREAEGSTGLEPTRSDLQAVDRLLARRAAAVRQRDEAAFLATVDPADAGVVAQQRTLFENLSQLRLAGFSYATTDDVLTPDPVSGRDPELRVQTVERTWLADALTGPVGNVVRMTFVRREAGWLLGRERPPAAVDPGDDAPPRPWFGGPISVVDRGSLVVVVDADEAAAADRLADVVEQSIAADASLLGLAPDRALLVSATANARPVRLNSSSQAEAAAVYANVHDTDALGRPTRRTGGVVQANPSMSVADLADERGLVRHELVHHLLSAYSGTLPLWVSEGIAEYARWYPLTISDLQVTSELWRRLQTAAPELPSDAVFQLDPRVHYLVAQAAVQHLVSLGGATRFLALLDGYREAAGSLPADRATPDLLREVYGITESELVGETWSNLTALQY